MFYVGDIRISLGLDIGFMLVASMLTLLYLVWPFKQVIVSELATEALKSVLQTILTALLDELYMSAPACCLASYPLPIVLQRAGENKHLCLVKTRPYV